MIAADWQFRALVRAQLLEEGYQVRSLPSMAAALQHLFRSDEQPALTILDMKDLGAEAGEVRDLWWLAGEAPLILCADALSRNGLEKAVPGWEELPQVAVLCRPFRVGDLVTEVRRMWAWSEGDWAQG